MVISLPVIWETE